MEAAPRLSPSLVYHIILIISLVYHLCTHTHTHRGRGSRAIGALLAAAACYTFSSRVAHAVHFTPAHTFVLLHTRVLFKMCAGTNTLTHISTHTHTRTHVLIPRSFQRQRSTHILSFVAVRFVLRIEMMQVSKRVATTSCVCACVYLICILCVRMCRHTRADEAMMTNGWGWMDGRATSRTILLGKQFHIYYRPTETSFNNSP